MAEKPEGVGKNVRCDVSTTAAMQRSLTARWRRVVGRATDADVQTVKAAGFTDGEIGEIVANVALNVFTNYFNETAQTDIDFPRVELKARAA